MRLQEAESRVIEIKEIDPVMLDWLVKCCYAMSYDQDDYAWCKFKALPLRDPSPYFHNTNNMRQAPEHRAQSHKCRSQNPLTHSHLSGSWLQGARIN